MAKSKVVQTRKMTRGERNIHWIESNLYIPEGKMVGKPFILAQFQKDILLQIYDNKFVTRRAIISMPRKSAKTALSACIMLLHLCGCESLQNAQLYSAARSREQAAILFKLAYKIVLFSPNIRDAIRVNVTKKMMTCTGRGTVYQALSKDANTALGLSPVLVIHDEIGTVRGPTDALYDALESASAAQEHPLSIIISTQARDDSALLSLLIDDAKTNSDPSVVLTLFECPKDADIFDKKSLEIHPAWNSFVNKKELLDVQKEAKRIKSKEASFRNYFLNQRIDVNEPFIALSTWQANAAIPQPWEGKDIFIGIDLSQTNDLTSVVIAFKDENKIINVHPLFWTPESGLEDRERQTRTPLRIWRDAGLLNVVPGAVIDYDFVAAKIFEIYEKANIKKINYDAYKFKDMKSAMMRKDIPENWIDETCAAFRQTTVMFEPAITNLENHLLRNELAHGGNPLLGMCMANVKIVQDSSRNRKFDKISAEKKIDGAVALAMAIQAMHESENAPEGKKSYLESESLIFL